MHYLILVALFVFSAVNNAALAEQQPYLAASDLAGIRDIGGGPRGAISVSPDGNWVAFQIQEPDLEAGNFKLSWHSISIQSGRPHFIADGGDILLNPKLLAWTNGHRPTARAKWAPDSSRFAYLVRSNGKTQIWTSRPTETGQVQLTRSVGDVMDFAWSKDSSKLYFETGSDRAQVHSTYPGEERQGSLFDDRFDSRVSQRPFVRICGDGFTLTGAVSLSRRCAPPVWVYDFDMEAERPATSDEKDIFEDLRKGNRSPGFLRDHEVVHLRQSPDGRGYAWLENVDPQTYTGRVAPMRIHASIDDSMFRCEADPCQAYRWRGQQDIGRGHQDMWWSWDTTEILFLRRDGPSHGLTGLYGWSLVSGDVRRILQTEDWLSECNLVSDRLICLHETWTRPRRIVSVSLEDGVVELLYDPNPDFSKFHFTKIEKLEWEDSFGNPTHGHLVYPKNYYPGRSYPLVIVTYQSRGFLRGGIGDEYPIHPLAAQGFFVLSHEMPVNLEKRAKAERWWSNELETYRRQSVLSSQLLITQGLINGGLVDADRVAITGLSEGSAQTTYAILNSDLFATGIATGSFGAESTHYLMNESLRFRERFMFEAPEGQDKSLYELLSIGLNADRVQSPILFNVSDEELLGTSENFARLKDAGKPVEMYVYPGEHHIKWQPTHRLAIYRRNIQWLKFWLIDDEEDDPVSLGQYDRWREMRDERCSWDEPEEDKPAYCEAAIH